MILLHFRNPAAWRLCSATFVLSCCTDWFWVTTEYSAWKLLHGLVLSHDWLLRLEVAARTGSESRLATPPGSKKRHMAMWWSILLLPNVRGALCSNMSKRDISILIVWDILLCGARTRGLTDPWRWRRYVPSKSRHALNCPLPAVALRKTGILNINSVAISNITL
jgi:hypothetical protein